MLQLFSVENVKKVGAAGVGAVAAAGAPSAVFGVGVTTTQAYATQAAVALVGSWAVGRWVGKGYAVPWFLGAGVGALQDPIRRAIAKAYGAVSAALPSPALSRYVGADPYYRGGGPHYLEVYGGRPIGPVPAVGRYATPFVTRGI